MSTTVIEQASAPGRVVDGRLAVSVLTALVFQIAQGLLASLQYRVGDREFFRSYWTVSYDTGFVRRGLGGEILQLLFGDDGVTVRHLVLAQGMVTVALVLAMVAIVAALVSQGSTYGGLLGLILVCAPFTFDFVVGDRRPDQIGFLIFILFGLSWARHRGPMGSASALAAGIAFALATLVHEGTLLIALPWAIVTLVTVTRREHLEPSRLARPLCALVGPSLVVLIILLSVGRPHAAQVRALLSLAASRGQISSDAVYTYLGDSVVTSVDRVVTMPASQKLGSLFVVLLSSLVVLIPLMLWSRRAGAPLRLPALGPMQWALGAIPVSAFFVLYATAIDWVRWGSWFWLGILTTTAFAVIARRPATQSLINPIAVGLLVYSASLAPLPWFTDLTGVVPALLPFG